MYNNMDFRPTVGIILLLTQNCLTPPPLRYDGIICNKYIRQCLYTYSVFYVIAKSSNMTFNCTREIAIMLPGLPYNYTYSWQSLTIVAFNPYTITICSTTVYKHFN